MTHKDGGWGICGFVLGCEKLGERWAEEEVGRETEDTGQGGGRAKTGEDGKRAALGETAWNFQSVCSYVACS